METREARALLAEHLADARATEATIGHTLKAHIALTPAGPYRAALERHARETREHEKQVGRRSEQLRDGRSLLAGSTNAIGALISQLGALTKAPLRALQSASGEEAVLRNARDECAAEAAEIAAYDAIEAMAIAVDDEQTAELVRSIRADEERMLSELREELPNLARDVVGARVSGLSAYDIRETGAARDLRNAGRSAQRAADDAREKAQDAAEQLRKIPGVARAEAEVRGAIASAEDLAIRNYDELTAEQIDARVGELSQLELATIHAYERRHAARKGVLDKIASLRAQQPWPGYDELTVDEIRKIAAEIDDRERIEQLRDYEQRHRHRRGVLEVVERDLASNN